MGRRTRRREDVVAAFIPLAVSVPRDRCTNGTKHRFADELDAKMMLANLRAADSTRRAKVERRAYQCNHCDGWHLTSEDEKTTPPPKRPTTRRA